MSFKNLIFSVIFLTGYNQDILCSNGSAPDYLGYSFDIESLFHRFCVYNELIITQVYIIRDEQQNINRIKKTIRIIFSGLLGGATGISFKVVNVKENGKKNVLIKKGVAFEPCSGKVSSHVDYKLDYAELIADNWVFIDNASSDNDFISQVVHKLKLPVQGLPQDDFCILKAAQLESNLLILALVHAQLKKVEQPDESLLQNLTTLINQYIEKLKALGGLDESHIYYSIKRFFNNEITLYELKEIVEKLKLQFLSLEELESILQFKA